MKKHSFCGSSTPFRLDFFSKRLSKVATVCLLLLVQHNSSVGLQTCQPPPPPLNMATLAHEVVNCLTEEEVDTVGAVILVQSC